MILNTARQPVHLGYCTNIHAGDAWDDVFPLLQQQIPKVRHNLGLSDAMGIGLRVSRQSLNCLEKTEVFNKFTHWLADQNFYVYTINGFPYGTFHGDRVKENVYKPDWTEPARLDYTCRLADLLCKLSPPDDYGSISTLPGTYKDWIMPGTLELISANLIKAVAHCVKLKQKTGITVALALEPEPCCMLETVAETIRFFESHLYSSNAIEQLMALCQISESAANEAMRLHIGVCYDVCHSAVEFEDPINVITRLRTAEIDIVKIQLSSALQIDAVNEAALRHLSRFDEPVYLHQVVEQRGDKLNRYSDIGSAIAAARHQLESRSTLHPTLKLAMNGDSSCVLPTAVEPCANWRIHYHVPVFIDKTEHFSTTQKMLIDVLRLQKQFSITRHLEVETYTWDVLPPQYRQQSVSAAVANEIDWVRQRL